MDQAEKLFYKSVIMRQKDELTNTLKKMDDHGTGSPDEFSTTELSSYDNHPGDLGTEVYLIGMNLNLKTNELYQVRELEESLERLEKGTYGHCEYCSTFIGKERLEARPQARLCIECAKSREVDMEYLEKSRPIEETVLATPFDRGYPDEMDDNEYEGLDQWNDLMKYGSSSTPQDMGGGAFEDKDYEEFYTNKVDKQGIVDPMDNISNEEYRKQLPD